MFSRNCAHRRNHVSRRSHRAAYKSSGNMAFDAYKGDTLRRLEEEQASFENFLQRLRESKDKAEFDEFMDDRTKNARDASASGENDDKDAA